MIAGAPDATPGAVSPARGSGSALLLVAGLAVGGALLPFIGIAPNRLALPTSVTLLSTPGPGAAIVLLPLALLALSALSHARGQRGASGVLAAIGGAGLALAALLAAGEAARSVVAGAAGARVSLGSGFWVLFVTGLLALGEGASASGASRAPRILALAAVLALACALAALGRLSALSLAVEAANRGDAFGSEALRHLGITAAALGLALLVATPLALLARTRPRLRTASLGALGVVQTLPSLALFGLLLAPLAALAVRFPLLRDWGLGGIGPAPAVLAIALYALLPLLRGAEAGFAAVPAAARDAARGLGFTEREVLLKVDLPLASPVIVAGLRVAAVQAVGLATLAALIGAGGFGRFVFTGLGQAATDLMLLGALPVVALALVIDGAFALLADALRAKWPTA